MTSHERVQTALTSMIPNIWSLMVDSSPVDWCSLSMDADSDLRRTMFQRHYDALHAWIDLEDED